MAKEYTVDILSIKSIEKLKKELEKYKDGLQGKCEKLVQRLADEGVDIAKTEVMFLDAVFTGELMGSIHSQSGNANEHGAEMLIIADSEHAIYVEFGTGTVGASSPYPYDFPEGVNWEYASGKTIRQISDGRYGWFYPADDGHWYFTEGMPSRPFMHNTVGYLEQRVFEIAREVFSS